MSTKFENWVSERLPVGQLKVCAQAQRVLDPARVKIILSKFDPGALRQVSVSLRDGKYYIVDGQHRVSAAIQFYKNKDYLVDCRVHLDLTLQDEAELFLLLNTQKATHTTVNWSVGITSGKGDEYETNKVLRELGLTGGAGGIVATQALLSVYRAYGGQFLREILQYCLTAFSPDDDGRFNGMFIKGLARFVAKYRTKITTKRLEQVLQKTRAADILYDAGRMATKSTLAAIVTVIVGHYDYKRPADSRISHVAA